MYAYMYSKGLRAHQAHPMYCKYSPTIINGRQSDGGGMISCK